MGFINPGKSLKKRRLRSTAITTSSSTSEIEYKHKLKTPHLNLQDLPYNILCKIFIASGPGNNLPIINKSFNKLFKFDKELTQNGPWNNLSLVLELIRKYYVFDLNQRLDFDVINKKLQYFGNVIQYYRVKYSDNNVNYKRLVRNYSILNDICLEYSQTSCVVLDKVLNNNFISNRLLDFFTRKYLLGDGDIQVKFLTLAEILFLQKLRLRVVRFKFTELSMDLGEFLKGRNNLLLDYMNMNMDDIIKTVENWDIKEDVNNPQLGVYIDERLPIKEIPYEFSFQINDGFLTTPIDPPSMFRIPPALIGQGINSIQTFQIVQRLLELHPDCLGPIDGIISKTLTFYQIENINSFPYRELPLTSILSQLLSNTRTTGTTFDSVIIEMFRLFDGFTKIDYSQFRENINDENIVQDLSRSCFLILAFYFTRVSNVDGRLLWIEAIKLRNIQLTQLLRTFQPNPEYDILHSFQ